MGRGGGNLTLINLGIGNKPVKVSREFTFHAAHWLPNVPKGHKCGKMHGHTYKVRLTVQGPIDLHVGWVIDYADIKAAFADWYMVFDHGCLNDIAELGNSTAEHLALFIADRMKPKLPGLCSVIVKETEDTRVEVEL
jgi:6-pyruvoyltetrahydropterin/6-carboxytetrahydropterin synthase